MNRNEMAARLQVMERLAQMMMRELPASKRENLMDRLIDQSTGNEGWTEIAEHWDRILTGRRAGDHPEDDGNPANAMDEMLARTKRRIQIFGPPDE